MDTDFNISPDLLRYSTAAGSLQDSTYELIHWIQGRRQQLDQEYPGWRRASEEAPSNYMSHDARRQFFVTSQVVLGNANLAYTFMKTDLCSAEWWDRYAGGSGTQMASQTLREWALMTKWFTFHQLAMAAEETIRAIVRASGTGMFGLKAKPESQLGYATIYGGVLRTTSLMNLRPLFDIVREAHDTIHTNGVYRPRNGKPRSLKFQEKAFEFEVGRELAWFKEETVLWIAARLAEAMFNVVSAPLVAAIPQCPRGDP